MLNRRSSILLIDDEEDYCRLIKMHLEGVSDYEFYFATTGDEGIKLSRELRPDVILLDIMMPGMNGFEVLEKLKKDAETIKIPVIMLSARDDEKAKLKAAQLYDESYITKPIDVHILKEKIDEVLTRRKSPAN